MVTVADIVAQAEQELSQVPGLATQTYADDRLLQYVENVFQFCFDDYWWPEYMCTITATLDGVMGVVTADLVGNLPNHWVSEFRDIQRVFPAANDMSLRRVASTRNPYLITGTAPMFMEADYSTPNRPIKVFPITSVGDIVIRAKQRPVFPFTTSTVIYLDKLMLALGAAYYYAEDDATAIGQINKLKSMFFARMKQIQSRYADVVVPLTDSYENTDQWYEAP
jgi:hypothetical protein